MARKPKNIKDKQFGDVTALEMLPSRDSDGSIQWRCVCVCGREFKMSGTRLRGGTVTHCGCKGQRNYARRDLDSPSPPLSPSKQRRRGPEPRECEPGVLGNKWEEPF